MLRKIMIGLVCSASISAVVVMAVPSEAFARGGHGGHGGHGGWGGHGGFRGGGFRGFGYYGYPAYYPYAYACYRNVRVATPFGWQWRRVYVCG